MTMTTTTLERRDDVFSDAELRTLAGFLGGYSGLTRDAYSLDLRQFAQWTQTRHVALFDVARADIEGFARHLEDLGRARATISRRLCTIACFYRYWFAAATFLIARPLTLSRGRPESLRSRFGRSRSRAAP